MLLGVNSAKMDQYAKVKRIGGGAQGDCFLVKDTTASEQTNSVAVCILVDVCRKEVVGVFRKHYWWAIGCLDILC